MSMEIRHVTVLGSGVLGSQIAFQSAFHGFAVTVYDISAEILEKAQQRLSGLAGVYAAEAPGGTDAKAAQALANITTSADLADAVRDADLIIEAIPEVLDIKRETYQKLATLAPERTIFASNSSTLLPSMMKDFTGRPEKFLALHFANQVWKYNTAEIMGTPETDPAVFQAVSGFAANIGMVPIEIHKEKAGYVLNSMLVPLLNSAAELAAFGYASPEDIDKVWKIGTGAPMGPFQIYDVVGLATAHNILSHGSDKDRRIGAWMKENYIDKGKMGISTGEGFYRYADTV